MTASLTCAGLDAGYGKTRVVRGFDLTIESGEVTVILGPNGAGKTTTLMTIAGFLRPLAGAVTIDGEALPPGRPDVAVRRGVVLVPDDRALFPPLTVRETLALASRKGGMTMSDVLEYFPQLRLRLDLDAGSLSGGEQQMLAVARGLIQRPHVLLIDEMSMGLAPLVVKTLMEVLLQLTHETNTAVLMVEQHVGIALDVADRAIVMVHGETRLVGSASELRADPKALRAAYLG